jgi:hypothetical protein
VQRLLFGLGFFATALLAALGCTPAVGDACVQSTDCSQLGDRLCDPTQFDGYCTVFNCTPDTCPDSVCVAFSDMGVDPACKAADDGRDKRFERQFCMKYCNTTSDCRDGYVCRTPKELSASIIDDMPLGTKVCTNDTDLPPEKIGSRIPGVCEPGDAGPPWTPFDGGVSP